MVRIVFDLDGTLIDSAPDIRACANAVLEAEGAAPLSLPETVSFIGDGTPVFVERMRAARALPDADHDRLLGTFLDHYEKPSRHSRLYPDVAQALAGLAADGHRLALCTNKPAGPTARVLDEFGLAGHFETVIGGDSLPVRKPDPAPLRAALDALGTGPAIYVGDSETDAETARAAAVPFLLFTGGYRKSPPEALPHAAAFADWSALPALVPRHAA